MNRIIDKKGLLFCGVGALLAAAACSAGNGGGSDGSGASSSSGAFGGSGEAAGSGAAAGFGNFGGQGNTGNFGGQGNTGNFGGQGNTGNFGGQGNTGNFGGQGNTGNVGGSGNTGNVGGTGNTGNVGGTGNTGNVGGTGNTGNVGGTGNTGNVGGTGNTGNVGGTGNTGGGGAGGSPPAAGPCITAQQGLIMGDSYVTGALSPALQTTLQGLDATLGMFKNTAVAGVSMATGGIDSALDVPQQWASVSSAGYKFAITDGGGNDILICDAGMFPGCGAACSAAGSSTNMTCQKIVSTATSVATTMFNDMAAKGVQDVIYFFYPHIPDKGTGGGGFSEILDYSEPLAKADCDSAYSRTGGKLACFFVDLVQPFKAAGGDANPANFVGDGIHPSQAGSNIIAGLILGVMKQNCIGFTAADATKNGCTCTM